jgi:hypothetical protein
LFGFVAVIDADSHLDENKQPKEGAPDVAKVHEALKKENISHCVHTTHSHLQEGKGNRYRIIIPTYLKNERELFSFLMAVVNLVNSKHNLNLYLTPESYRWAQVWQFPRISRRDAPFFSAWHHGVVPSIEYATRNYPVPDKVDSAATIVAGQALREEQGSLQWYLAKYLPIGKQLHEHGYEYCSQGLIRGAEGKLIPVQRWTKPGSSNPGGVVVFNHDGVEVLYSHHSNDPLAVGHGLTTLGVYQYLHGLGEDNALEYALAEAEPAVISELNLKHPSFLVGGSEFRVGNPYNEVD